MINLKCGHRCRADPVEAATYLLEAEGKDLKTFRSYVTADLKVEVEEQDEKKTKTYDMEVPVNISREHGATVRTSQ